MTPAEILAAPPITPLPGQIEMPAANLTLDLFAGPGGWSEGIRRHLGLTDVGLEWDDAACRTRAAAGHHTVRCDVAQYPAEPFIGRVRGLIASPPCQAWSRAGKRLGIADQPLVHQAVADLAQGYDTRAELLAQCKDPRSLLAAEPMRYLHATRPEWTVMEEVPDVLPLFKQYAEVLRSWGYSVWTGELNAADYGVPQTRRRAILIASRVRQVAPPEPTHAKVAEDGDLFGGGRDRWVSMAEALGWTDGLTVNTRGERRTPGGNEFSADQPSWALTEKTRSWALRNGNQPNAAIRPAEEPAPTMAFGNNAARIEWVLRNGTQANDAYRPLDQPAGTLFFGARCNDISWVLRSGQSIAGEGRAERTADEPAVTITSRADLCSWVYKRTAGGYERLDANRPAPSVKPVNPSGASSAPRFDDLVVLPTDKPFVATREARDMVGAPTHTVRITVEEASVLQSFAADYPWQGTKTKRFEQIGNAVPPLLAAHVVSAATGIPLLAEQEAAA